MKGLQDQAQLGVWSRQRVCLCLTLATMYKPYHTGFLHISCPCFFFSLSPVSPSLPSIPFPVSISFPPSPCSPSFLFPYLLPSLTHLPTLVCPPPPLSGIPMQWVPRNMSLWSSIAFTLAAITNLLVCLFYPFDKGSQLLGETH